MLRRIVPPFFMKALILIRHSKSSWDNFSDPDFDRPLKKRGKSDAGEMAERLLDKNIIADLLISSPARRAKSTAELFAAKWNIPKSSILFIPGLYEPELHIFRHVIEVSPSSAGTIAIFSHNPAISHYANSLTNFRVEDMPTTGVFGVKADIREWGSFTAAEKQFWFFDYPKSTDV